MTETFFIVACILALFVVLQWLASVLLEDASLVDRFWGGGFALAALVSFAYLDSATPRGMLLLAMAVIWGLRLSIYLTWRNWGQGEDYRYVAMRERHGSRFLLVSLFTVFLFQGALTWFISLPLQVGISAKSGELNLLDYVGAALWFIGVMFEAVGDVQLARFKADPANKGKVMDRGLWRYTRHPNYFGNALLWWGIYLVAASAPYGAYTILSPALMTFLLLRVSGVRLLEKKLRKTRPAYADYVARTNAFIPGPPKKAAS
jgi:steroid 5-alpha reductase family enzyme